MGRLQEQIIPLEKHEPCVSYVVPEVGIEPTLTVR
jgi:hypothetical protein